MGSVYNRGDRSKPNWWASYKDADGQRKWVPTGQPSKAQAKQYLAQIEARIANGLIGIEVPKVEPRCGELMDRWASSLRNRNARDDQTRLQRHVVPVFSARRLVDVDVPMLMKWIDDQRAASKLSDASIRHNLNLLSRFFSWAVERGHAQVNPVRQIPPGKRPKASSKQKEAPWVRDDSLVVRILELLREPMDYMFYLGNRSGLRNGELAGLRMSDLDFVEDGAIRVRYSYDGPLKEDKDDGEKTKWVPAAEDFHDVMDPWLERRRSEGAGPEDLVFLNPTGVMFNKKNFERGWKPVREALGLKETWYQATRHSFASRSMANGASLDEVSDALGHSSPVVTRRYYDHFVRRKYSDKVRAGLSRTEKGDGDEGQE